MNAAVKWVTFSAIGGIFGIGCTVGPNYRQPRMILPQQFSERATTQPTTQQAAQNAQLADWWQNFHDPQLDALIRQSITSNLDLRAAEARLLQSRAQYGITSAAYYPQVNTTGQYQRRHAGGVEANSFSAGFDASWEVDVWGGIRRGIEAANGDIQAAVEDRRDVLVTLTAEVAQRYIEYRGFQQQIEIARENIRSQVDTLGITRRKYEAGLKGATELDVARAQALVETSESALPALDQGAKQAAHRLAILMGLAPGELLAELAAGKPIPQAQIPEVPLGLPSELLRRRPDVRRAERQLAAATARIGVATADLFPRFSLTGALGLQSSKFSNWVNASSRFWNIGPSVSWPIFDAGRIRSNIRLQNAFEEQALIRYQQTVLTSMGEAEDAIVAYTREQIRRKRIGAAVESNKLAVTRATQLYDAGLTDSLSVLDAQRSLFSAQDQLVQSNRTVSTNLVALYKALGGGWEAIEQQPQQAGATQQGTEQQPGQEKGSAAPRVQ